MRLRLAVFLAPALSLAMFGAGCTSVPETVKAAENSPDEAATLPFGSRNANASSRRTLVPHTITVPAGTPITVRLQKSVSSTSSQTGEEFAAVLDDDIVVDGVTVVPRGAAARGQILAARPSGTLHNSGYLRLALASMEIEGNSVRVHTSSVFVSGGSHKKRNLELIGGGAGSGALLGPAGGGTAGAYATGNEEVSIPAERRLTFRLTTALSSGQ